MPALRTSHFPDPPDPTLRPPPPASRAILRPVPGACPSADSQPTSSAICFTPARTGAPSTRGNEQALTQRGAMSGSSASAGSSSPGGAVVPLVAEDRAVILVELVTVQLGPLRIDDLPGGELNHRQRSQLDILGHRAPQMPSTTSACCPAAPCIAASYTARSSRD